jgi:hypothetical protein
VRVQGTDGVVWPVPPQPPYLPDGATHHGFAHGTAGVAAFLLDAATSTGRVDQLEFAYAAGVAAFLLRLWRATGGPEFRTAAHGAPRAVRRDIWHSRPVHCHGTAGCSSPPTTAARTSSPAGVSALRASSRPCSA